MVKISGLFNEKTITSSLLVNYCKLLVTLMKHGIILLFYRTNFQTDLSQVSLDCLGLVKTGFRSKFKPRCSSVI